MKDYLKKLAEKHVQDLEHLTRDQLEAALEQAIKSGDFVRATMQDSSPFSTKQGIFYIPYNLKIDLDAAKETIIKLREALEFYGNRDNWEYHIQTNAFTKLRNDDADAEEHSKFHYCGKRARTILNDCFGDTSE